MAEKSFVTVRSTGTISNYLQIPTDESVSGLLFDYTGFTSPFASYHIIADNFGHGETHLIHNLSEAEELGLYDNGFMNNVPYYHIKQYYQFIKADAPLYIAFTNGDWDIIEQMQMSANGKIAQIGIWTAQAIWTGAVPQFTDLIGQIEAGVEAVSGKVGLSAQQVSPLSVVVSPNTKVSGCSLQKLSIIPDGSGMDCPKVSVCLLQNGTEETHAMQSRNPSEAPVGAIGAILAFLSMAYAEECIGYVAKFNLNADDLFLAPEIPFNGMNHPLESISPVVCNLLSAKKYIVPTQYDSKEAGVFLTSDPTLSNGDYGCIANNRIIHKCRRCVYTALLPRLNGNIALDLGTGGIDATTKAMLTTEINDMVNQIMVNRVGDRQFSSFSVEIDDSKTIVQDDKLMVRLHLQPINYSEVLIEDEEIDI